MAVILLGKGAGFLVVSRGGAGKFEIEEGLHFFHEGRNTDVFKRAFLRLVWSPSRMNTRRIARITVLTCASVTSTPASDAKVWCPVTPPRQRRK